MVEFAKSLLSAKSSNRKSVLFPLAGKGHSERLSIAVGPGRRRLACKPAVCKTRKTPRSPETGVTRSKSRKGCRRCRSTCGDPATARDRRRRGPRLAKGQRASHARPPQAQGRGGHPARSQRLAPGPAGRIRLIAAARPRLSRTACRPSDRRRKRHVLKGKPVPAAGGGAAALSQPGASARLVLLTFLDINRTFQCKVDSAVLWGGVILSVEGLALPRAPAVTTNNVSRP